jgi:Mg2+/Co2+ transporter CorB
MTTELAILVMASIGILALSALFSSVDTALLIADDIKMSILIEQPTLKARTWPRRWYS